MIAISTPEERKKFEKIYVEYRNLMYNVAHRILNNRQDAEDAVHQSFIKIAGIINTIDDSNPHRVKGLVVTIVENESIDMYRYKKRHPVLNREYEATGISIDYEGENILTKCIEALPVTYCQVILLKHYHGYTSKEVAQIMGLSVANIIKINQRAKKKLRILCEEEGLL